MKDNKVKVKKKTKKTQLVAVILPIATLSVFVFIIGGNFNQLMNNSVSNYYCLDSSFDLRGKECVRNIISTPLLLGDVNLDGEITKEDIDIVKKYINKQIKFNSIELIVSDVDKNKDVNNKDVLKMEKYIENDYKEYVCQKGFKYKDKNVCIKEEKSKALKK